MKSTITQRLVALLVVTVMCLPTPLMAMETQNKSRVIYEQPSYLEMAGDVLIARPIQIAATVVGGAIFLVTLPFSLLGMEPEQAAEALVFAPGRSAFKRCLGCTKPLPAGHTYKLSSMEGRVNAAEGELAQMDARLKNIEADAASIDGKADQLLQKIDHLNQINQGIHGK